MGLLGQQSLWCGALLVPQREHLALGGPIVTWQMSQVVERIDLVRIEILHDLQPRFFGSCQTKCMSSIDFDSSFCPSSPSLEEPAPTAEDLGASALYASAALRQKLWLTVRLPSLS